jgi:hypothetical protein
MMRVLTNAAAFGLLFTSSTGALAQALQWRVSESAGPVTVLSGAQKHAVTRGEILKPGDTVQAGPGGRAVLVHDRDFVTVSANSRVTVPTPDKATGFVKLLQDWGNAVFKIEKLGKPHFGVNTPSLAAVVKGTTFSITVDRTGTSLQVTEGVVEVATLDGGARDLIRPGGVANISAADPLRLNIRGDASRVIDSSARPQAAQQPEPAAPETSAAPASAPEPVPAASSPAEDTVQTVAVIEAPIASKPVDLGGVTRGLVSGTAAATQIAAVTADVRTSVHEAAQTPGTKPDAAGDNANTESGAGNGSAANGSNSGASSGDSGSGGNGAQSGSNAGNDNSGSSPGNGNGNGGSNPGSSAGSGKDNGGSGANSGNGNSGSDAGNGNGANSGKDNGTGKDDVTKGSGKDDAKGEDKTSGKSDKADEKDSGKDAKADDKDAGKDAKDSGKDANADDKDAGKDAKDSGKDAKADDKGSGKESKDSGGDSSGDSNSGSGKLKALVKSLTDGLPKQK